MTISGDINGMWTVWGDGKEPIAQGLGKSEAVNMLRQYHESGRDETYAEHDETAEIIDYHNLDRQVRRG